MPVSGSDTRQNIDPVLRFLDRGPIVVLTGAGLSTSSGIPAYRDRDGNWQHSKPIEHKEFIDSEDVRQRYWARSFLGWPTVGLAKPTRGHETLAHLESLGRIALTITQNVDGLHQKAGSRSVLELHGGLHRVACLRCQRVLQRAAVQEWMREANPDIAPDVSGLAPDGDAFASESLYRSFCVPVCPDCEGVLKPDVVFFGDFVPRDRVDACMTAIDSARGVLVVGSSLMVYSGFRFIDYAHRQVKPIMAINLGRTRADHLFGTKIEQDCDEFLSCLRLQMG
ncbi:MAG: NAD-dependent protein deacetylase [Sulfuritalea sp.]|nr:NAD-dependent protein deacetylase [Sulfuritalea sp.]